jgi:hypothetical protein
MSGSLTTVAYGHTRNEMSLGLHFQKKRQGSLASDVLEKLSNDPVHLGEERIVFRSSSFLALSPPAVVDAWEANPGP